MWLHGLLTSITLSCCLAGGDLSLADMMMGAPHTPHQSEGGQVSAPKLLELANQREDDPWKTKVLNLLSELVLIQKQVVQHQSQVVQQLGMLGTQGSQQVQELHNLARHQNLLVENHQALLLQTSRIATHLQDLTRKPAGQ
ncbi:uncharacterized protein KZ484_017087 [Pholidichthys leucotaenia]